jgi:ACR3 family arsenite efflux pump ArsB
MSDERESAGPLRNAALSALVVGAAGSIIAVLYVGRKNQSFFLITLFAAWVLSPFVALAMADVLSRTRLMLKGARLHFLMLMVTSASLTTYGYVALGPQRGQRAFAFLIVPLGSWVLIGLFAMVARPRTPRNGSR